MIVDKIKRMQPDSYDNLVYPDRANELIDMLNALRKIEVIDGQVHWSDNKVTILFSGSLGSNPTPSTGSGNTFVSSSVYCLSRWS